MLGKISHRAFLIVRKFGLQKGKLKLARVKYFSGVTEKKKNRKVRIQT